MLRKAEAPVDAQTSMEAEGAMADLEALEEDFAGDFDSLDDDDDGEEVSFSADASAGVDSKGVDKLAESEENFDEDFSIDPDEGVDTDEDSWGEFDNEEKKE
jgi:hypothetical protein